MTRPARRTGLAVCLAFWALTGAVGAPATEAATWRWVDEQGATHYGDLVPPRYANRAEERREPPASGRARTGRNEASGDRPDVEATEHRQAQPRPSRPRTRRDALLLATYASEEEIELARARELRRNDDTFRLATAPLLRLARPEDRRRFDALMDQNRRESERINARFDAAVARFRELAPTAAERNAQSAPY